MFSKCLLLLFCSVFIEAQYPYDQQRCPWPRLDHGRVRVRQRTKLVKFMCLPRYELVGNRYATCKAGNWDVPMPVCVRSGCDAFTVANSVQIRAHHEAWVTTFCLPGYTVVGSPAVYCNGYKWNATVPRCVANGSSYVALSCDFEEPDLCGWMQDDQHDFDWVRLSSKTPSSFLSTGPSYDHTFGKEGKGYYMYIESTSKLENNTARLLSPVYDSHLAIDGCFSFFYHMYGQSIGGLRVYQKPDSVQMSELLDYSDSEKRQYIIFEQWGNLGDFWYSQASQLKDFKDSFQIVIEGIRGTSFTSDIAIDDVALLQGVNCTYFRNAGTTPVPPGNYESCAGRCEDQLPVPGGCECSTTCVEKSRCCPDYMEICVFTGKMNATDPDDMSSTADDQPQTEKLIGEPTTTTAATPPTITIPTITTNPAPTTKPTTQPTTKPTTITTVPTTKLTTKSTTNQPTTTKTTTKQTTTKPTTTKLTSPLPTTVILANVTISTSTTTNITEEEKKKAEKEVNVQKMPTDKLVDKSSKSSAWKTVVITAVALAALAAAVYLGAAARSSRGRAALARLRGRVAANDPEVRYLNSNDDDDL